MLHKILYYYFTIVINIDEKGFIEWKRRKEFKQQNHLDFSDLSDFYYSITISFFLEQFYSSLI